MSTEADYPRDDATRREPIGGGLGGWILGALIVIALAVLAVVAFVAWTDDGESEGPNVGVTLNDIAEDPEEYAGTTVTVSGEVNEVVSPQSVTIGGEGFFGGSELLIANAEQIPVPEEAEREDPSVLEGDLIQVTGTVRMLTEDEQDEFGDDYSFLFEDDAYNEFEGEAVVVADTINLSPRLGPLGEAAVSIADVTDDPEAYEGLNVQLVGEVELPLANNIFSIRDVEPTDDVVDTGGFLPVAVPEGMMPEGLTEDALVQVEGTIHVFDDEDVADLGDEFSYLEEDTYDVYEDAPIVIAESVNVGPQPEHIDLESVVTSPDTYLGTVVTVTGTVEEVVDGRAFIMASGEEDDPVVDTSTLAVAGSGVFDEAEIVDGAFVRVTGEVREFDEDETIELGDTGQSVYLGDNDFDDFDGNLVIVVQAVGVER